MSRVNNNPPALAYLLVRPCARRGFWISNLFVWPCFPLTCWRRRLFFRAGRSFSKESLPSDLGGARFSRLDREHDPFAGGKPALALGAAGTLPGRAFRRGPRPAALARRGLCWRAPPCLNSAPCFSFFPRLATLHRGGRGAPPGFAAAAAFPWRPSWSGIFPGGKVLAPLLPFCRKPAAPGRPRPTNCGRLSASPAGPAWRSWPGHLWFAPAMTRRLAAMARLSRGRASAPVVGRRARPRLDQTVFAVRRGRAGRGGAVLHSARAGSEGLGALGALGPGGLGSAGRLLLVGPGPRHLVPRAAPEFFFWPSFMNPRRLERAGPEGDGPGFAL